MSLSPDLLELMSPNRRVTSAKGITKHEKGNFQILSKDCHNLVVARHERNL